jgi:REP element-mobilizing transposase RayT
MPVVDGRYRRPQLRNARVNYRYGWFFVTFQMAGNKSELGAIVGEECELNRLGETVKGLVETLPKFNPEVFVDCLVVMPNHVHLVVKIDDRPGNDEHHLGKIMRKLKSLAAREYRLLKEQGLARDIGTKLWQENYWEKIVTSREQLDAVRRYIANNPKNWSVDRFGPVTSHAVGNLALLDEALDAFVASEDARGDALAPRECTRGATARGATPPHPNIISGGVAVVPRAISGGGAVVPRAIISTFTSPQEREILARLIAQGRRFIAVYPGGIPAALPRGVAESVKAGRALLLSPVASGTGVNKQRAVWCNEYVVKRASRVWRGYISPGGTLHSILRAAGYDAEGTI